MENDSGVTQEKEALTGRERQLAALRANEKPTQFGGERANPQSQDAGGNKPWSVHNSIRHLAAQPINRSDPKAFDKLLRDDATGAQAIAANTLQSALNGDARHVEIVIERIDGKVANTNLNGDLAALMGMSDDELKRIADGIASSESVSDTGSGTDNTKTA